MGKGNIFVVLLISLHQISLSYEQTTSPQLGETDKITQIDANKTSTVSITKTSDEENKYGIHINSTEPTEYVSVSVLSTTPNPEEKSTDSTEALVTSTIYNNTTPNADHNSTAKMVSFLTKGVMITACVSYFGLFILCFIKRFCNQTKAKSSYAVLYSRVKDDHDDTMVLMQHME